MRQYLLVFICFLVVVLVTHWTRSSVRESNRRRKSRNHRTRELREQYYADVLELQEPITPSAVRRNYRRLIAQYHPDKVQHLGDESRTVAETKAKEINEAYEYLRRRHRN